MSALPFKFWKHADTPNEVRVGAGSNQMVGRLRNFADGAIQVIIPEALRDKSLVTVTFTDDCVLEGTVLYCNPKEGAYRAGIYFASDADSRRKQPRYAAPDEAVKISFLGSRHSSMDGCVVDFSKGGIGLRLLTRISLGEWVKVEMKSTILFGEIRHCRQDSDGTFRAGVEIETVISRTNPRNSQEADGGENWILFEQSSR